MSKVIKNGTIVTADRVLLGCYGVNGGQAGKPFVVTVDPNGKNERRLGGLVEKGSLVRGDQLKVNFEVTDGNAKVPVAYQGILPDLFREGQGVISEGALDTSGVFHADAVLAKHDETYMPKAVADELKKEGHWKDDYGKTSAADAPGTVR